MHGHVYGLVQKPIQLLTVSLHSRCQANFCLVSPNAQQLSDQAE